ncbi:hypothetical protein BJV78DRAFT_1362871 [Lactifluus subvellereus]|nr:hypothetical protein BJV78DRAFT_1362871 [Lactifluus subvellereus]
MSSPNHTRKPISHPPMGSGAGMHVAHHQKEFFNQEERNTISFQRVTIGSLPDNVLLDMFDFYQEMANKWTDWLELVHVCRRWRYVVFASPYRLDLRFIFGSSTPAREVLDVWPPIQIIISDQNLSDQPHLDDGDNIIAALEHRDRVCDIELDELPSFLLERLATVTQEPFPVLTNIRLSCFDQAPPVLPDTFLGGSAPRLQSLYLSGIPSPALPKLLLSARDLVSLTLYRIPHTGYISPEAMVTCLSALTNLEWLTLEFESPSSRPDRGSQRPPPLTRVDLPALTWLQLQGVSEYLEDFLARINTPVITTTTITFFNRVVFNIPQLFEFLSRTEALGSAKRAELFFNKGCAILSVHRRSSPLGRNGSADVWVRCDALDWKISFLVQICSQLSPLLSSVERLDIKCEDIAPLDWQDDVDHTQWLEIFRPFIAVQSLHIFGDGLDELIAPALQELTGVRVMEVLPALHNLFVLGPHPSGSARQAIEPFITARQLSNQPVTVHWGMDREEFVHR